MSRPKSKLPTCIACLFRIGWGIKRIVRHTGFAKTTVHRFARAHGLIDPVTAEQKKAKFNERRKRRSAERKAKRKQQIAAREAERASKPKRTAMDYYRDNRDVLLPVMRELAKVRYQRKRTDPEFIAKRRLAAKAWRSANADKKKEYQRAFWKTETGRNLRRENARNQRRKPYNRVVFNLRRRLREYIRAHGTRTVELIGCTTAELRTHIERQFRDGMSWENYGQWHVDHIRPCAAFDLTDYAQRCACFHFTNLQPLWAEDNILKSDRLDWHEAA
jgi:hypothetical protein